jgi:hypothetical protein
MSQESELTPQAVTDQVRSAAASLQAWARAQNIPFPAVLEAFRDETVADDVAKPPFHRTVCWADIHTPSGVRIHMVAREGSTPEMITDLARSMHVAFEQLCEHEGFMPADRLPKTPEQVAATRQAAEEAEEPTAEEAARAQPATKRPTRPQPTESADPGTPPEGETRTIDVDSVRKLYTDNDNLYYLVKGSPWRRYGVKCWPDSGKIARLGALVDLDSWAERETYDFVGFGIQAVVRLKPDGKPDRVVDWRGEGVIGDHHESNGY